MTTTVRPRAWRWAVGFLGLAFGLSLWAAWGGSGCRSCGGAADLFPGTNLAALGASCYAVLLAVWVAWGPSLGVSSGVALAAGIHGGLVAILIRSHLLCLPCVAAAAAAGAALGAVLLADPASAVRSSFLVPGAALAVQSWALLSGGPPAAPLAPVGTERGLEDFGVQARGEAGKVRMLIYTRPDCGYCLELERDILPGLEREFGPRLAVERRSAESLPGIPTPTIILSGSERRRVFPGLPAKEELERAIALVIGTPHDSATLPPESR